MISWALGLRRNRKGVEDDYFLNRVYRVSEALIFGSWMMGQALAFAPNFGAAVSAAGRVMTLLARTPRITSTTTPTLEKNYVSNVSGTSKYKLMFNKP